MAADTVSPSFSQIHALTDLIVSSVGALESACKSIGTPWPSLDTAIYASQGTPSQEDIARLNSEAVMRAAASIVAAATQLARTVREPGATAATVATGVSG
jgi:hypothetical protein